MSASGETPWGDDAVGTSSASGGMDHMATVRGAWEGSKCGGCPNFATSRDNPCFSVALADPTVESASVVIELEQLGPELHAIGLVVLDTGGTPHVPPVMKQQCLAATPSFKTTQKATVRLTLAARPHPVLVMPCTYMPGCPAPFALTLFADQELALEPFVAPKRRVKDVKTVNTALPHQMRLEGRWDFSSAGGSLSYSTASLGPHYGLLIGTEDTQVTITLSQTLAKRELYAIALMVVDNGGQPLRNLAKEEVAAWSGQHQNTDMVTVSATLAAKPYPYVLFPSTFFPGEVDSFVLTIEASARVEIVGIDDPGLDLVRPANLSVQASEATASLSEVSADQSEDSGVRGAGVGEVGDGRTVVITDFDEAEVAPGLVEMFLGSMVVECYRKGDFIVRAGEMGTCMYFVSAGTVEIDVPGKSGSKPRLTEGTFFGEIAMFLAARRTASVRAASTAVEVCVLTKEACEEVLAHYPGMLQALHELGEARLRNDQDATSASGKKKSRAPKWMSKISQKVKRFNAPKKKANQDDDDDFSGFFRGVTSHRNTLCAALANVEALFGHDNDAFEEILVRYSAIVSVLDDVCSSETAHEIIHPLISVFESHYESLTLVRALILKEVARTPREMAPSLFRSNTLASRLLTEYCAILGKSYLELIVGPGLARIQAEAYAFNINEHDIDSGEAAHRLGNVLGLLSEMAEAIWASLAQAPLFLRMIVGILRRATEQKFPDHADVILGGFIFLRFICPAIVSPHKAGLWRSKPTAEQIQVLVLVSKTLQKLSNGGTRFSAGLAHTELDAWIQSQLAARTAFLDAFGVIPLTERTAVATADYAARDHDELDFSVGDEIVAIRRTSDPRWLYGEIERPEVAGGDGSGAWPAGEGDASASQDSADMGIPVPLVQAGFFPAGWVEDRVEWIFREEEVLAASTSTLDLNLPDYIAHADRDHDLAVIRATISHHRADVVAAVVAKVGSLKRAGTVEFRWKKLE